MYFLACFLVTISRWVYLEGIEPGGYLRNYRKYIVLALKRSDEMEDDLQVAAYKRKFSLLEAEDKARQIEESQNEQ